MLAAADTTAPSIELGPLLLGIAAIFSALVGFGAYLLQRRGAREAAEAQALAKFTAGWEQLQETNTETIENLRNEVRRIRGDREQDHQQIERVTTALRWHQRWARGVVEWASGLPDRLGDGLPPYNPPPVDDPPNLTEPAS